jgi:plastocyanin
MRPRLSAVMCAAFLSLPGCGGSSGYPTGSGNQNPPPAGQPPSGTTNSITVKNNHFDPSAMTVPVGTTVSWTWDACADDGYGGRICVDHNVTFDDGGASSTQSTGSWSRQFNVAGTFTYHCTLHSALMTGQVVVR